MRLGITTPQEEYIALNAGMRYFLVLESYPTKEKATSFEVVFFIYAILARSALYITVTL